MTAGTVATMSTRNGTRRTPVGVGLLAAITLLVGACGGDDDTPAGDAAATADDDGGSSDPSAGDGGEPDDSGVGDSDTAADDFPIPRPDGLVLDALADSGISSPGQRQLYYDDDDFDRVVGFYDEWTVGDGGWTRTESGGIVVFSGSDTERIRSITITPDHDPGAQADGPVTYVLLIANG